ISRRIVETVLRDSRLTEQHFVAGRSPAKDLIVNNVCAAIVRHLPRQMCSERITRARETRRFRRECRGRVSGAVHEGEQISASGLPGYAHVSGEVIWSRACNTLLTHTAVA